MLHKLLSLFGLIFIFGTIGVKLINHNITGLFLISVIFCIVYRFYFIIIESININKQNVTDVNIIVFHLLTITLMMINLMIEICLLRIIFIFCNKLKNLSYQEKQMIYKMRLSENLLCV